MPAPPDDETYMRRAIDEARRAVDHGDVPIGCVIVVDGAVVSTGHNEREHRGDPTAHAEVLALRDAAAATDDGWRLTDATVYVTLEPCPMCAGALVNARVARVVYGAADLKAGALASLYGIGSDPRLNHEFAVTAGVLADECADLLTSFFTERRGGAEPAPDGPTS